MMRPALRAIAAGCFCLAALPASAHDFWLQPDRFVADLNDETSFALQVGHGDDRQRSQVPLRRIMRFAALTPEGDELDLRAALHLGGEGSDGRYTLRTPGAYVLLFETDNKAQNHLPAAFFNAYLRTEGLEPALAYRAARQLAGRDGAERYSRVAKAIVQAGPAGSGAQDQAARVLGLPLEIILARSPYLEPQPASLPVQVRYEGRPLAGGLVKLTSLEDDAEPVETQLTDQAGHANFKWPGKGSWVLNVVWTKPVTASDGIDFETIFSSLSFGIPR